MARYTYNAVLVEQAIEKLYTAEDALNNTNVDIQKGITTITNARGAENISVDFSVITGYQSQVVESIDLIAEELRAKAQEIEEYQSAPWYKKLFATIGMGALKIVEGLATFVENIGDGLVSIVGFVGGIFSSEFKDSVAEFVKTDYVGDAFAGAYEEGWLQDVNKYSVMSHESTAANVLKGVGVAAGYVILSVATAGAGTAVSLGVSAAAAGVGGIGSGTQSGLQAGKTFNQAFGEGVKQGAVAAGTTLLVGGLANKLGSLAKGAGALDDAGAVLASSGDDVTRAIATSGDDIINAGDDVLRAASGTADEVLKTGASFADEVASSLDDGAKIVGKAVAQNGDELVVVQNAAGQTGAFVKSGGQVGRLMTDNVDEIAAAVAKGGGVYDDIGGLLTNVDDIANVGSQAAAAVDDVVNAGSQALAVVDDVANAGSKALSVVDDVANAGSKGLSVVDDVANAGSKGLSVVDDVANAGSKALSVVDDVANAGSKSLSVVDDVANAGSKALSVVDDVANAGSKALSVVDDVANAGSKGLSVVDDVVNIADDVAGVADDAAKAAKPGLGQRIVNKVDKAITNFGTNTKVGQALSNAAGAAGPTVTNAVAAVAGPAAAGTLADPVETSAYRDMVQAAENPTVGQTLYQETEITPEQIPTEKTTGGQGTTIPTGGTTPGSETPTGGTTPGSETPIGGTTPGSETPIGGTTPGSETPTGGTTPSGDSTISTPSVDIPDYPTDTTPSTGGDTIPVPETTIPDYPGSGDTTPDDIIGGNDDILPTPGTDTTDPSNPQNPSVGGITGGDMPNYPGSGGGSGTGSGGTITSSEVLDTFGDMSGSLNEIIGNNKTNIPTSSAPILSGDGTVKKSMIPLGAGLGAAALAGIGTKAYLDKKSKSSEEDEENIDAEEWEEDADSVEIDYGLEENQEGDYLSPTDEYAFQE